MSIKKTAKSVFIHVLIHGSIMASDAAKETSNGIASFPQRLRESMEGKTIRGLARECGLSESVLRSYLRGDTFPSLDRLVAIAIAAGVSETWLATGEGHKGRDGAAVAREPHSNYGMLDKKLIGDIIEEVESCLQDVPARLSPAKKRELIMTVYDISSHDGNIDPDTVRRLIKLAS